MDTFDRIVSGASTARTLTLSFERRSRSRQRVVLDDGSTALLALPRGTVLRDGDTLGSADGPTVRVQAAAETVSAASHADPATLLRAAYHLGNRHVAVDLRTDRLQFEPDHVLGEMLRRMHLTVTEETSGFEPEGGAYQGGGHDHQDHGHAHHEHEHAHHEHEHAHDTAHGHAHEPAHEDTPARGKPVAVAVKSAPHVHGPGCGHDHHGH